MIHELSCRLMVLHTTLLHVFRRPRLHMCLDRLLVLHMAPCTCLLPYLAKTSVQFTLELIMFNKLCTIYIYILLRETTTLARPDPSPPLWEHGQRPRSFYKYTYSAQLGLRTHSTVCLFYVSPRIGTRK